jgi:hypothetical protein
MLRKISRERAFSVVNALDSAGRSVGADIAISMAGTRLARKATSLWGLAIEKNGVNCQTLPAM